MSVVRGARVRATVFVRLLLILAAVAALPTFVVMAVQERALVADLGDAAEARLERARHAARGLLDSHVEGLAARYRAVSGTPQFRATLELGDEATLRFYAGELARREGAVAVAFASKPGDVVAGGGEPELARRVLRDPLPRLFEHDGAFYASVRVPLATAGQQVGSLVAVERLTDARLAAWSDTCGATLAFEPEVHSAPDRLSLAVMPVGSWQLTISTSLAAELRALSHARRSLAAAGGAALAIALFASVLLSRSWVRPIVQMQRAAERVGAGDFEARVESTRRDEFGDVARAFDGMTEKLRAFREEVGRQRRALETKVRELRESRERLRGAQRLARMGSWRFDVATGRMEVSEELLEMFGLSGGSREFTVKDLLALVHPDDRQHLAAAGRTCLEERSSMHVDHRLVLPDGSERILQIQARFVPCQEAGLGSVDGTAQDVTERRRSEEQIRFLAYHDGLTGLGNRRLFSERLDLAAAESRRSGEAFGVLVLDLDHFKRINDTLGHSVGDRLLQGVADRLVASVRETDLVARPEASSAVCRFGGDEFAVLLTGLGEPRDLARVGRRLLASLARPFGLEDHDIVITGSIGVAVWPGDGEDGETLLRNADAAMYHAKEHGRNNCQFYTAELNDEALQRLLLESRLRRALEREELEVHYQPKLDRQGRQVLGVEALVRWRDPELGMILPGAFVPVAEEAGLIGTLGDQVLRRACADRRRWSEAGLPAFPVSVNLSAHQFRDGHLAERVARMLEETGLAPELLELEITESTLLHDEAKVAEALEALRQRGVQVAVDDFGTGYSSLAYLRLLPVDALKIDRSFVRGIADSRSEAALTAAIVAMGRALGLRVIAEGVETDAQRDLLASWECDELQGFLLARPMPEPDLERWLRQRAGAAG